MRQCLGWEPQLEGVDVLDCPWVEFAHTPQLPHLGVVRMLATAHAEAGRRGGLLLFCVNDHLPARELAESRYLPLILKSGKKVAESPSFGLSKASAKQAMNAISGPRPERLREFRERWLALTADAARVNALAADLEGFALRSTSHADWLVNAMLGWFSPERVLILPTTRLQSTLPDVFDFLANVDPQRFWHHCAECGYRLGRLSQEHSPCPICAALGRRLLPDVVARQAIVNALGLSLRVCGREKPYQSAADDLSLSVWACAAPERLRMARESILSVTTRDGKHVLERINLIQALMYTSADTLWHPAAPDQIWEIELTETAEKAYDPQIL